MPGRRVIELFHVSQGRDKAHWEEAHWETHLRLSREEHSYAEIQKAASLPSGASSREVFKCRVFSPAVMRERESWNRGAEGEV